ncbi:MAG TPA: copper-containing nitrite reductase [Elusimicrobiota bacterium]|nr:copper-containing nitrite reductase [Elusimicrobiota bacterium]
MKARRRLAAALSALAAAAFLISGRAARAAEPVENAVLTYAPNVPPRIARRHAAVVQAALETSEVDGALAPGFAEPTMYRFWTFNGHVPGPFIRVREGDTLELTITNSSTSVMAHSIDMHAVTGPGGGSAITLIQPGESKTARFKMLHAGLFIYHCAAPPVTDHIANGMYGLILVQPKKPLPPADKTFYVMQSEFYTKQGRDYEGMTTYDRQKALDEYPTYVVFNGSVGSLTDDNALHVKTGQRVRIYFGNIGPNKVSSFHIIGTVMDKVWDEGGIGGPVLRNIQTTLVPAGGAAILEFTPEVPGTYTMMDHSIFRMEKGAVGQIVVSGPARPDIYEEVR